MTDIKFIKITYIILNMHVLENIILHCKCNYVFHDKCIDKWLIDGKQDCPNCRTLFK